MAPAVPGAAYVVWSKVADGARIHWLVLQHGGMERIPLTERLAEPASAMVRDLLAEE